MTMSSTMDVDVDDTLVSRRSKRSTAGNRMEAALAELGIEDLAKEAEDDNEFFIEKDEEDIFGSDFESTDEEAVQVDEDIGDKAVDEEEKRARKAARTRLEKTTAAAHARNKATFNPQASTSTSTSKAKAKKVGTRVSFADAGQILDDEDDAHEEVVAGAVDGSPKSPKSKKKAKGKGKRKSRRSHTVLNTSATVSRMKTAEKRRATNPKKQPMVQKSYTQAQLLSRALDTEEGNIIEHRDYLQMEEEKRRRARVVRKVVEGPKVRWVSRGEEVRVQVPVQAPVGYGYNYGYASGSGYYPYPTGGQHYPNVVPNASGSVTSHYPNVAPTQPSTTLSLSTSTTVLTPTPVYYPNQTHSHSQPQQQPQTSYYYSSHPSQHLPPPPPTRLEKVCKNYVVHDISQGPGQTHPPPKPAWEDTMAALFGDDVKWEDMKVWNGKGRPLSRPKKICPITSLPAPYLDPRTNVPYANVQAYETLTDVLKHEYVWSKQLGCYVGKEGERRAMGLEGRGRKGDVKGKGKSTGEKGKDKAWGLEADATAMEVS